MTVSWEEREEEDMENSSITSGMFAKKMMMLDVTPDVILESSKCMLVIYAYACMQIWNRICYARAR